MEAIDWNELQAVADEAGIGTDLPDGQYEAKVIDTNVGQTQGTPPKPQIGVFLEVTVGPYAGKRFWSNLTLTRDNPKAVAMFVLNAKRFGVPESFFTRAATMDEMAATIKAAEVVGIATLDHRIWNGTARLNVKSFKPSVGAIPGAPVAAPAVAAGVVPAPVSVPGAAPVSTSAPAAVPPPPVVPGTSF